MSLFDDVKKNLVESYAWFVLASRHGKAGAATAVAKSEKTLSAEQLEAGKKLAGELQGKSPPVTK